MYYFLRVVKIAENMWSLWASKDIYFDSTACLGGVIQFLYLKIRKLICCLPKYQNLKSSRMIETF